MDQTFSVRVNPMGEHFHRQDLRFFPIIGMDFNLSVQLIEYDSWCKIVQSILILDVGSE